MNKSKTYFVYSIIVSAFLIISLWDRFSRMGSLDLEGLTVKYGLLGWILLFSPFILMFLSVISLFWGIKLLFINKVINKRILAGVSLTLIALLIGGAAFYYELYLAEECPYAIGYTCPPKFFWPKETIEAWEQQESYLESLRKQYHEKNK